jgi:hypothetical protein
MAHEHDVSELVEKIGTLVPPDCLRAVTAQGLGAKLTELLYGERGLWLAHRAKLITSQEVAYAVAAHLETWLTEVAALQPGDDGWKSEAVIHAVLEAINKRSGH